MIPRQLYEESMVLVGCRGSHDNAFEDRTTANKGFDEYIWNRPVNGLASPPEMMILTPGMLVEFHFYG